MSDPISSIPEAAKSIADLVSSVLDRVDRDKLEKELNDNITEIQNSFANSDLDAQYVISYKLLTNAGLAPTPSGDVGESQRSIRHEFMIATANLIYERKMFIRAFAKITA